MAKRPNKPADRLRDAVESTMQATAGSAGKTRNRAQGAVDDLVDTVDEFVKGAGARVTRSREAVKGALDPRLPASQDDVRELKRELRAIGRRLDAIEERLPTRRTQTKRSQPKRSQPKKRSGSG